MPAAVQACLDKQLAGPHSLPATFAIGDALKTSPRGDCISGRLPNFSECAPKRAAARGDAAWRTAASPAGDARIA
jgi:hypothetical protein